MPQHILNPLKKWQTELQHSYETLSKLASSLLPAFGIYVHEVIAYKKHRTCDCSQQSVHKHELPFSLCCCYINWHHAIKTPIQVMVTELVPPIHIALVKRVQMPYTTIWQCPDLSFTLQVTHWVQVGILLKHSTSIISAPTFSIHAKEASTQNRH